MTFKGLIENNGWTMAEYNTIWKYGYDFMLAIVQIIIEADLQENSMQIFTAEVIGAKYIERTQEVIACENVLANCSVMKQEYGILRVCGISKLMECPICLDFFNQTNLVKLSCPAKQCFQEKGERAFDIYMDAIEIQAHCLVTKRKALFSQN
ncbi:hypothetical protein [Clostridium sp. MD294]|uniref:hypothetical protein n=1 Tax=Clostridium sp. MD294 TaxID=97138 RepID=UPI0002C980ED|nr:hypothetical protein [Clostridium sp. MD294]NDO47603.1 hypothetical protein [Clostridium sp. MD294]USF30079.1 hypothetical protein C820_001503 [Clostridium sp. MD294]